MPMTDIVIAHCRAGFENECAGDIEHVAALAGMPLGIDAPRDRGFVTASGIHDHMRLRRLTGDLFNYIDRQIAED